MYLYNFHTTGSVMNSYGTLRNVTIYNGQFIPIDYNANPNLTDISVTLAHLDKFSNYNLP